jgi:HEPN domain-containing protein
MLDPESPEFAAAHNLWSKGKGHVFGALAIDEAARQYAAEHEIEDVDQFVFSGHFSASLHFLIGFAAELLIKAAYILHGGDPAYARKPGVGHDLIKLLDAAEAQGFVAPDANTRDILEYLREPHLHHQFRYGMEDEVPMPDLKHTFPALQALSNYVQDGLEAQG